MKVSVVIVSYNVFPFLDNCLRSVRQALQNIDGEIIVVDNASVDRTPQLVSSHFPDVQLIANGDNKGFAKANNQALRMARGEYVLLLNPDTIVSENTISTCIQFADHHPDAGAIGVKMLDGSGSFLPESKRGLPTLRSSFMKMTGLYKLFPKSKFWNGYYAGHIGADETAKVDILTGAFMFLRKSALDMTGLLDEDFFMYGEDIDLSYRMTQSGFANYYVPNTTIIHYKGESTRKSSLNYILTFYQAMLIFTDKHPELKGQQRLIRMAIYLHGIYRFILRSILKAWPVMLDAGLWYISFYTISQLWSAYYFQNVHYFPPSFYTFNIPLYTWLAIVAMYFSGAYDKPYEPRRSWTGFFSAWLVILIVYAFLPIHLRTSRMVIVLGCFLFMGLLWITRRTILPWRKVAMDTPQERRAVIVAGIDEANRIKEVINRSREQIQVIGLVAPDTHVNPSAAAYLGTFSKLHDIIRVHQIREIIFSAQDVPITRFTATMTRLGPGFRYMLAASHTMNIVGSMNKDTEGEAYGLRVHFQLSHPASRRSKRLLDILAATVSIGLSPVLIFFISGGISFVSHALRVLIGDMTWVGYHPGDELRESLPPLRPGVISPAGPVQEPVQPRRLEHIHYVYARDYHWTTDISLILQHWKALGKKSMHENN